MVHPTSNCILSNRYVLNLFITLALIFIYIHILGSHFVHAASEQLTSNPANHDEFHEDLYIRPLSDGKLLAHFQFVTTYRKDIKSLRWENKIEILPLTIVDLVTTTGLRELHFSLTKGNWDYKNWGYPTRSSPPGAQIRAAIEKHSKNLNEIWRRLTNSLAGKFCASLSSANEQILVKPKLSFKAEHHQMHSGSITSNDFNNLRNTSNDDTVLYANLPEETLCTGNLTPWKKLLPCYSASGLASLLNPINLFRSSYSSLAVDLEPKQCTDQYGDILQGCERVQLKQTITVVFNPLQQFEGKLTWSLAKIFGSTIKSSCPVAQHSLVHVDITELDDKTKLYPQQAYQDYSLNLGITKHSAIKRNYATFDSNDLVSADGKQSKADKSLNIGVKQNKPFKRPPFSSRKTIPISLRTHIAGLGAYDGTIVATINNALDEPVRVTYMDIVPHFIRLYLHTLQIKLTESGQELKPEKLDFVLSRDDTTPTLIEFSLVLPAKSHTQISYDFERAFMRWTDFKPDANKGYLLSSAMVAVSTHYVPVMEQLAIPLCSPPGQVRQLMAATAAAHQRLASAQAVGQKLTEQQTLATKNATTAKAAANSTSTKMAAAELQFSVIDGEVVQIYSRPLLVILPTPDFSMPYNVLCMVCTTLVFVFGPIYNVTVRRPIIKRSKQEQAKVEAAASETKKTK